MLYSVIICIAYALGILWGLYLDLYLGVVSFFLVLCVFFIIQNSRLNNEFVDDKNFKIEIRKIVIFISLSFLFGLFYSNCRAQEFDNRYAERNLLWQGGNTFAIRRR